MSKEWVPKEYQIKGMQFIRDNPRCAFWAGMGTGKTSTVLTALQDLDFFYGDVFPALVVAPLRPAVSTWPDETRKWAHLNNLKIEPVIGDSTKRRRALRQAAHIYTINFENLPWLIDLFGHKWPFRTIVVDEATKLKGFRKREGSTRAKSLAKVAFRYCTRFIELSGTPVPNGYADLWGQIWFLDQGERLGRSYQSYCDRWFSIRLQDKYKPGRNYVLNLGAQTEIQERIEDICLSISGSDYFDVKQPIVNKIYVDLPKEAAAMYKEMEDKMFFELEGVGVEAVNAGAKTLKCLQIANGQVYTDTQTQTWSIIHREKIAAMEEIINEANGTPVLVSYVFKHDLWHLRKHFPLGKLLDDSPTTIRDWNAGKIPILFAHPASAGHGLNLQDGSNILVYYGHDWNLENHLQIAERVGPMRQLQSGHDREVYIHHIIARNTVEDWGVMERLTTKRRTQDILLDAMKRRKSKNPVPSVGDGGSSLIQGKTLG